MRAASAKTRELITDTKDSDERKVRDGTQCFSK